MQREGGFASAGERGHQSGSRPQQAWDDLALIPPRPSSPPPFGGRAAKLEEERLREWIQEMRRERRRLEDKLLMGDSQVMRIWFVRRISRSCFCCEPQWASESNFPL